jgi:hypothetical protein
MCSAFITDISSTVTQPPQETRETLALQDCTIGLCVARYGVAAVIFVALLLLPLWFPLLPCRPAPVIITL